MPIRPLRCAKRFADLLKRDGGGVGRQDGVAACARLCVGEHLFLDLEILGHRLDKHVGVAKPGAGGVCGEPCQGLLDKLGRFQPALVKRARPFERGLYGVARYVLERHLETRHGGDRGYVAAHGAGTYHMDALDGRIAAPTLLHQVVELEGAAQPDGRRGRHEIAEQFALVRNEAGLAWRVHGVVVDDGEWCRGVLADVARLDGLARGLDGVRGAWRRR